MGTTTNGLLFFGFEVGGSEASGDHLNYLRLHDDEHERTAEEIEELASDPTFDEYGDEELENPESALYELAKTDEWKGLTLSNVCSHSCEQFCLTHDAVQFEARRGRPIDIDPSALVCPPEVLAQMKAFCERFRIPWQEPKWMLGSYWG